MTTTRKTALAVVAALLPLTGLMLTACGSSPATDAPTAQVNYGANQPTRAPMPGLARTTPQNVKQLIFTAQTRLSDLLETPPTLKIARDDFQNGNNISHTAGVTFPDGSYAITGTTATAREDVLCGPRTENTTCWTGTGDWYTIDPSDPPVWKTVITGLRQPFTLPVASTQPATPPTSPLGDRQLETEPSNGTQYFYASPGATPYKFVVAWITLNFDGTVTEYLFNTVELNNTYHAATLQYNSLSDYELNLTPATANHVSITATSAEDWRLVLPDNTTGNKPGLFPVAHVIETKPR